MRIQTSETIRTIGGFADGEKITRAALIDIRKVTKAKIKKAGIPKFAMKFISTL
jgi:hypothetical protein